MDNVWGLLIAILGGAAASLIAGYAARPKTKAEAKKENATADVTMSGDAREWANFWATKAQALEAKIEACEQAKDDAEERTRVVEADRNTLVEYVKVLEIDVEARGGVLPPLPQHLRDLIRNPEDF